jgi:hypothetical protein
MKNRHIFWLTFLLLCTSPFPTKSNIFDIIYQQRVLQELEEAKNTDRLHATINLAREIQVKILNYSYKGQDELRAMDIQLLCVSLEEMIKSRIQTYENYIYPRALVTFIWSLTSGAFFPLTFYGENDITQWRSWHGFQKLLFSFITLSGGYSLIASNSMRKLKAIHRTIDSKFQAKPLNNKKLSNIINFYYDAAIEAVKQQKSFLTIGFNNLVGILTSDREKILRSINGIRKI